MDRVGQSELGANFGPTLTSFSSGETCRLPKTPRSRQLLPQTVWRWPTDTSHSLSLQPLDRSPSTTLTSKSRLLPKSTVRYTLRRPTRLTLPRFRELKRVIPARPYHIANMNGRHAGNTLSLTSSKQSDDQRHPALKRISNQHPHIPYPRSRTNNRNRRRGIVPIFPCLVSALIFSVARSRLLKHLDFCFF
jgi:hypothetical protein